ncbi:hypothetical protein TanjilG_20586 [Lupinus angustifolius]|uniref:Encoded peptide n=1 Tax=Lupinus angustifolius TaxID=3871 RepID=A0A4P1QR81_LUPAN|nr:hypothetical protein TanjilG_20586 [Lupinus angustifolius]
MAEKTILLTCLFFLIILQYNFGFVTPSRVLNLQPPAPETPILRSPLSPSVDWYTINDDNDGKGDAFRPTSPGHSPGVGHQTPPRAP